VRVAALYDIHGNVPALEAVLADVERAGVDEIVWGGDVAAGPMPAETLARMRAVGGRCVSGNADREMIHDTRLGPADRAYLAAFEPTVSLDIDGLGGTLFCHGSPRSDEEVITRATPDERFAPMVEGVDERVIVCGHTHQQFDRRLAGRRVVNAGAVGMPYEGIVAAFWAVLGPEVDLRRTYYDVAPLIETLSPDDREMLHESLIEPVDPEWVTQYFESGVAPSDQP
jgi:predicted phosphodiesterase